jgi:hypothetical protein
MSTLSTDVAIVVQGQADFDCWAKISEQFSDYVIIFSCWTIPTSNVKEFEGRIKHLSTKERWILCQKPPRIRGVHNLNLQKISTMNGVNYARKLGFKFVLKWRSDQIPVGGNRLVREFYSPEHVSLLFWHKHRHGYLVDYSVFGLCDDLSTLFDVSPFGPYPEYSITWNAYFSGLHTKVRLVGRSLRSGGIDIFWPKHSLFCSTNNMNVDYTVTMPEMWLGHTLPPSFDERRRRV